MKKTIAALAVLVLLCLASCSGARISAPAEEVQFVQKLTMATVIEFIEHYLVLDEEDRGPTDAERKYWESKITAAKLWYSYLLTKVEMESSSEIWGTIFNLAIGAASK